MIVCAASPGGLLVAQHLKSPSVYLDHWAIRDISSSPELSARFSQAITGSGGTLALSWMNAVEFTKVSDDRQRGSADSLLEHLGHNLFWLNPDFFTVGQHEHSASGPGPLEASHADHEFATFYAQNWLSSPHKPVTLFSAVFRAPGIAAKFDAFADLVVTQLEAWRAKVAAEPNIRSALEDLPDGPPSTRGTRILAKQLIRRVLKDTPIKLNRNNSIDLAHACVSASYCDYVLLDGQWASIVNDARRRLAKADIQIPIAQALSKRDSGIEKLLLALEER
jgi:hypothetical protein